MMEKKNRNRNRLFHFSFSFFRLIFSPLRRILDFEMSSEIAVALLDDPGFYICRRLLPFLLFYAIWPLFISPFAFHQL